MGFLQEREASDVLMCRTGEGEHKHHGLLIGASHTAWKPGQGGAAARCGTHLVPADRTQHPVVKDPVALRYCPQLQTQIKFLRKLSSD